MPKTKDDRIQKVLEILNLPAEEQLTWVALNNNIIQIDVWEWDDVNNIVIPIEINWRILADLAFRMRDEADESCWDKAKIVVWVKYYPIADKNIRGFETKLSCAERFFTSKDAQPIHWICAALIAEILNEK